MKWILILALSNGHSIQTEYPTSNACEIKRQEYRQEMFDTANFINESTRFEYKIVYRDSYTSDGLFLGRFGYPRLVKPPNQPTREELYAKYPKARPDRNFLINSVECWSM